MKWSCRARAGFPSRNDIVFGIKTSLYPSLTYGLMATALNSQQAHEVFKLVRKYAMSQMGYNTNMPKEIVHGPNRYGGMGLGDIYTVQGTEHVKVLLDEMSSQSPTRKLLRILHPEHQLECGQSTTLYDMPYAEIEGFLTLPWVTSTLECGWSKTLYKTPYEEIEGFLIINESLICPTALYVTRGQRGAQWAPSSTSALCSCRL